MTTELPEEFEKRMRSVLGNEYEAFAQSLKDERVQGLRFNSLKAGSEKDKRSLISTFDLRPVPWCDEGFTYSSDTHPGSHPCHDAGVYYIQEPSAMAVTELMDVRPGEKILDLCAAPGGKSTHIASKLGGSGLLLSNEIHPARARILSGNIERMGIRNAVVTQEDPRSLAGRFNSFFDKVLVDVPCSGEGMFRKDEEAVSQWSEENIRLCVRRGQEILDLASSMLKPGGTLLYSTCTFEREEDEGAIEKFLSSHREFSPAPAAFHPGFSQFSMCSVPGSSVQEAMYRLWPHRIKGEGHFMALLLKSDESAGEIHLAGDRKKTASGFLRDKAVISAAAEELNAVFNESVFFERAAGRLILRGNDLYAIPEDIPPLEGLHVLRTGLCIGSVKKNRFEPSHALALTVRPEQCRQAVSLESGGETIKEYLSGQTIPVGTDIKGWVLVCADGYSLGWGKAVGGVLKNHYPKGLRRTH